MDPSLYETLQNAYSIGSSVYNMAKQWRSRSSSTGLRSSGTARAAAAAAAAAVSANGTVSSVGGVRRRRSRSTAPPAKRRRIFKRRATRRRRSFRRKARNVPKMSYKNLYTRKFKSFRKFNTGRFSIGKLLSNGYQFPKQTFARMSCKLYDTVQFVPSTAAGRQLVINAVVGHTGALSDATVATNAWSYLPMFKMFYSRYLILGAKTRLTIQKPPNPAFFYPPSMVVSAPTDTAISPPLIGSGYWYVRLRYFKDGYPVGYSMPASPTEYQNWSTLRDFLEDPTVMYVKDVDNTGTKVGYLWPSITGVTNQSYNLSLTRGDQHGFGPQVYYEISQKNKLVSFTIKYSAKKHHGDKNYLKNGPWSVWDAALEDESRFYAYYGYIAFGTDNLPYCQTPIDGFPHRRVTINTTAYIAMQDPKIGPSDDLDVDTALGLARTNREELLKKLLEGEKDAKDALLYSITRNRDETNPELSNELEEEIQNLLEDGEEDEEDSDFQEIS